MPNSCTNLVIKTCLEEVFFTYVFYFTKELLAIDFACVELFVKCFYSRSDSCLARVTSEESLLWLSRDATLKYFLVIDRTLLTFINLFVL